MNTLKLIVQGELIHEIPLDFSNIKIIEQREHYVHNRVEWLKYSYRKSLLIYSNWEIIMEAESKMNKGQSLFDLGIPIDKTTLKL